MNVSVEALLALREFSMQTPDEGESHPSYSAGIAGRRRGAGHDFYDLRLYEQGDDPRYLDAASSARSGVKQIRRYHEEVDQTALLVADFRSPMFWGTKGRLRSVAAAYVLSILGWRHIERQAKVGLFILFDQDVHYLAPAPRDRHMMRLISEMANLHEQAKNHVQMGGDIMSLAQGLEQIIRISRRGGMVELATGFDDGGDHLELALEHLGQRSQLRVLNILDACQVEKPKGVFSFLSEGETHWGQFRSEARAQDFDRLPLDYFALNAASDAALWSREMSRVF